MSRSEVIAQLQSKMDAIAGSTSRPDGPAPRKKHGSFGHSLTIAPVGDGGMEDPQAAFKKIVDLVNASDKSEATIRSRLSEKGFSPSAIDASVDRAKEYGFIDDRRYADVLVRSRIAQGKGSVGIERELKSHNIEPESLAGWPFAYDIDDEREIERALDLLSRKPPRSKNVREAAYRKLLGKGYSSSVASSAARTWACQTQAEASES